MSQPNSADDAFGKFLCSSQFPDQNAIAMARAKRSATSSVLAKRRAQRAAIKCRFGDVSALLCHVTTKIRPAKAEPVQAAGAAHEIGVLRSSLKFGLGREDAVRRAGLCLEETGQLPARQELAVRAEVGIS